MEKNFNPRISIVIPVFNDSKYVKEAIDSALAQTYENTEIIVINSGCKDSDKTEEICKSYGDRIRYFKKENGEVSSTLNLGVEKMKGEYLLWISHDLFQPEEAESLITKLTSEENHEKTIVIDKVQQESSGHSEWQTTFVFNPEVRINECHLLASKEFLVESITDDEIRSSLLQKLTEKEIREYVKDKVENYWSVYYYFKEIGYEKFPYVLLNRMHEIWGKEKKVSVIVPVYKVEKYIEKCLESLLEQTLMELEIIVVNDGTPDNSAQMAENYIKLCPSFTKIIHKENGGLGSARNKGLEYVSGKYVGFVDSDDYVDKRMFEKMYEEIILKNLDVVVCEFIAIDDENLSVAWEYNFPEDIQEWDKSKIVIHSTLKLPPAAWNKLFKRELLNKMPWGDGFYEDLQATPTYLSYAEKIGFIKEPYYYYRVNRKGSIMATRRDDKRSLSFLKSWENLLKGANPKYKDEIIYAIYIHIIDIIFAFPTFTDEYLAFFREKEDLFKSNKLIINDCRNGNVKDLFNKEFIPKRIFYTCFEQNSSCEISEKCLQSWRKYAPEYELVRLDETNCDISANKNIKGAYERRKFGLVSDYFKLKNIYENGGFYIDLNIELKDRIDFLRLVDMFLINREKGIFDLDFIGGIDGNLIIKQVLDILKEADYRKSRADILEELRKSLEEKYKLKFNEEGLSGDFSLYSEKNLPIISHFHPKVSIVIPVYNGSNYVKEAIDSALSQTYKNTEVIVVNDGSTDEGKTDEICRSYGEKIRYIKKKNGGVSSALNLGIEKMEGDYFSWLSHDDVYYPNKIEEQVKALDKLEDKNTVLYSNVEYIDENSETLFKTEYEQKFSIQTLSNGVFPVLYGYANGCTILIPKKCLKRVGVFNEELKTANDYDMWFRLFKKCPVKFVPETLIGYRFHSEQGTKTAPETSRVAESERVWINVINDLEDEEVESYGVDPVKFYYDLAKRMKEASKEKTYKLAMKKAKKYYKENKPVVSVIMPCYNSERYLEKAIDSILEQTFPNFELIIIDDGSTDKTWEIIQRYKQEDYRIVVSKNIYDKGVPGGMNTGLDLSKGDYITRMDSDDISLPSRFEKQVGFLKENIEYGFCSVNMSAFGKINSPALYKKQEAPLEWLFFWSNPVPSAAAMYRAEIISENNIRFRDYKVAQDYDFLAQVATQTKGYVLYDESLYHYRIHVKSNFHKNLDLVLKNSKEINANFVKRVTDQTPPAFHWQITEFAIPNHGEKDLDFFELVKWMEMLLHSSKNLWEWDEKEYKNGVLDAQKRIKDYFIAKTKREFKKEIEQKELEIEHLRRSLPQERFRLSKYPSLFKKKYKRFWELIRYQGWKTTLKNIILKLKKRKEIS